MNKLQRPPFNREIVDAAGVLTTEGRVFFNDLVSRVPSFGDIEPENNVSAVAGATYYNLSGATGQIMYIKSVSDIDGDEKKGWVLV